MTEATGWAEAKVMRAIQAREHKRAIEERQAAQAAHRAAITPAPSTVGWSTKPDRVRKPTLAELEIADAAAGSRDRWRRASPAAAAGERATRKARAEVHRRWDHKAHGTPETHEHADRAREGGALARLAASPNGIDAEQLAAAVEIATVAERIGADVAIRTASLEARVDMTRVGDGGFFERLSQVRHEVAYTQWRSRVPCAAAVLDMIVGETIGYTVVAKRYRMSERRAKALLIYALDLWREILWATCKAIDPATLAGAHAGILG